MELSLRERLESAFDFHERLGGESDRGAAILAAADFENWLGEEILAKLNLREGVGNELDRTSEALRKRLLKGPLRGVMAKVEMACALRLYDEETRVRLSVVRVIRNKFAHAAIPIDFGDETVSTLCQDLGAKNGDERGTIRDNYLAFLGKVRNEVALQATGMR